MPAARRVPRRPRCGCRLGLPGDPCTARRSAHRDTSLARAKRPAARVGVPPPAVAAARCSRGWSRTRFAPESPPPGPAGSHRAARSRHARPGRRPRRSHPPVASPVQLPAPCRRASRARRSTRRTVRGMRRPRRTRRGPALGPLNVPGPRRRHRPESPSPARGARRDDPGRFPDPSPPRAPDGPRSFRRRRRPGRRRSERGDAGRQPVAGT